MTRATILGATLVAVVTAAPADPDFSAERFKAHVTFLADDLLEGREAGTRGHEIAAKYIAAQFALFGLQKYLSDHYHQPSDDVSLPIVWSAGAKFAEVNYRVVRTLADADIPAKWYEGDYFGNLFAPKASKAPRSAGRRQPHHCSRTPHSTASNQARRMG